MKDIRCLVICHFALSQLSFTDNLPGGGSFLRRRCVTDTGTTSVDNLAL